MKLGMFQRQGRALKGVWARILLTVLFAGLVWAAWVPLAQGIPNTRVRWLLVVFLSVVFIWKVWPGLAHGLGNFQARLLLTILYGIFVFPFGMVVRLFADPLRIKKRPTRWLDHPNEPTDMAWARRQ